MYSQNFWEIFLETGAPEMYLLYNEARKQEDTHASDNTGSCVKSHPVSGS